MNKSMLTAFLLNFFFSYALYAAQLCPPAPSDPIFLGDVYNLFTSIDLVGNAVFIGQTNVGLKDVAVRTWYYSSTADTYSGPFIISHASTYSRQLTFSFCKNTSTAVAAWVEGDHIVARSKPSSLDLNNWEAIQMLSTTPSDQPNVFMNAQGDAFLVWRGTDVYGNKTVEFSKRLAGAATWDVPIILETNPNIEFPRVAANTDDDYVVTWIEGNQLFGITKPNGGGWGAVTQLSTGYSKVLSVRQLVLATGGIVTLFVQDGHSISSYKSRVGAWVIAFLVSEVASVSNNMAVGANTLFAIASAGEINATTASVETQQWSGVATRLNSNNAGVDGDTDANILDHACSIWGSANETGPQIRYFNGTALCDIVTLEPGIASGAKVAMNNLLYADPANPSRPLAHFVYLNPLLYKTI